MRGGVRRGAELAAKSACEWEWKWVHVESAKWQPSASRLLFLLFLRLCFSVLLAFSFGGKGSMLDFFWLPVVAMGKPRGGENCAANASEQDQPPITFN